MLVQASGYYGGAETAAVSMSDLGRREFGVPFGVCSYGFEARQTIQCSGGDRKMWVGGDGGATGGDVDGVGIFFDGVWILQTNGNGVEYKSQKPVESDFDLAGAL